MTCAVYLITCKGSGKRYVGASRHAEWRWNDHQRTLHFGTHINSRLQQEWNAYGPGCMEFAIIEVTTPDTLEERELYWYGRLRPELNLMVPNRKRDGWTHSPGRRGRPFGRIGKATRKQA